MQILPGVKVVIAHTETRGPLGDSHLGEVRWPRRLVPNTHVCSPGHSPQHDSRVPWDEHPTLCSPVAQGEPESFRSWRPGEGGPHTAQQQQGVGGLQIPWREEDLLLLRTRPRDAGSAGLVATSLRLCPCVRVAWDRWDSLPGGREAGRARPRQVGLWRREPSRAPSARLWGHAMAPASWHQAGTRTLLVHAGSGGWHTDTAQSQSNQDRCERARGLPGPAAP